MKYNVPVQSLIDHIKTAVDVDPWAKEMVEELLKDYEAVEGHRTIFEYCAKDTKDVVNEVIKNLCHPSDDKPGICCCAIKCQEHTNKNDMTL